MKKLIFWEFIILLAGTLFAWTIFTIELVDWLAERACTLGCPANLKSPFLTPCFGGAIFFLIALILIATILKKSSKRSN